MRASARTRSGIGVYTGLGGLLFVGLFIGPLYLMGWMLAGAVKLVAWAARTYAGRAARPPDNRLAPPSRRT